MNAQSTFLTNRVSRVIMTLLFGLCAFQLQAQVKGYADTTQIRIGEQILYTIEVEADSTALVLFPEGQSFGALEVVDSYPIDTTQLDVRQRLIKKYGLTQFDSGRYKLPVQRVMIADKTYATDSLEIYVQDVPVDTLEQQMFDIKPVALVDRPPFEWGKVLWWLLPLLILAGIGYLLFRRKKKKEAAKRQLPPYEEAMEALSTLDEQALLKADRTKEYYSNLTEIVKRYLHREVDEQALESTSDELIERLKLLRHSGHIELDNHTIKKLDALFKRADLVKFAKMRQEEGQARADRSTIEEVINETREALPEPTEEELMKDQAYLEMLARKKKRKQWIMGTSMGVVLILLTAAGYGAVTGFDNLKDKVLGNATRSWSEGRWYPSEYGTPAVLIHTPEILVRVPDSISGPQPNGIKRDQFQFGRVDELFVAVSTAVFPPAPEGESRVNTEAVVEQTINELEATGAINIIVKQESFSTEKGIKGIKAYGDFNYQKDNGKILRDKMAYEFLFFEQEGGLQTVSVIYPKEDFYGLQIKNRVINSVELEIQQATAKKQQP